VYEPYATQHTPSAPLKVQRLTLSVLRLMTEIWQLSAAVVPANTTRRSSSAVVIFLASDEGEPREQEEEEEEEEEGLALIFMWLLLSIVCCWLDPFCERVGEGHLRRAPLSSE
jgi:hypothetical protein